MKRNKAKLHLETETVKVLRDATLESVVGGASINPTYVYGCTKGAGCPATYGAPTQCAASSCLTQQNCVQG